MIELLDDPAYRHVLLNHVPIIGLAIALVVLAIGAVRRESEMLMVGLALVAFTAGSGVLVGMSGDDAYAAAYEVLDGDGRAWLDYHTHLADGWLPVLYANAALAVIALGVGFTRRSLLLPGALVVSLATLAGIGAAAWIGEAGGKIKHPEFRLDDPPVVESSRRLR